MSLCYNTKCSVRNRKQNADVVEWQTRYLEVVVSYARVGSSPVICTICGYGGIGRHDRFRFYSERVQVQVLLSA